MKSYVVIGLGMFGSSLAMQLYDKGNDVLAIDMDSEPVEEIADKVTRAVVADAKKKDVLLQLGVQKCDAAVVAIGEDLAAAVITTINLKSLGIKEIICKAMSETDKEVLETLGATTVVIPEDLAATRMCNRLTSPNALEYIQLSSDFSIIEMNVPTGWLQRSILDINVRAEYGVNIIAIRKGETMKLTINPNEVLTRDDILLIMGSNEDLEAVQRL